MSAAQGNFRAAADLGLIAALADPRELDRWAAEPLPEELARIAQLRTAHAERVAVANAPGYHADVANALDWLRRFHVYAPSRTLFVRNASPAAAEYNAHTFALLFEFIRDHGSKRQGALAGAQLKSASIMAVKSTLAAFLSRLAGGPLLAEDPGGSLAQAAKQARGEDGPANSRALSAPLRAAHLRAAFAGGLERWSPSGIVRAAANLLGHNVLARGRDLAADGAVDPTRDLTVAARLGITSNWVVVRMAGSAVRKGS